MQHQSHMIAVDDLTFAYPGQPPVFAKFNWRVATGEIWSVLGPSACGKSTLLLLLAGLLQPQEGRVSIHGEPVVRPRPRTSLVLQAYDLLPWATVRENIALGLRIRRFYGPDGRHAPTDTSPAAEEVEARVHQWLARLDIADVADEYPGRISGGQRQRTAIARALVLRPDLLLMDEPFSALDAPTREGLQDLTLELSSEVGLTIVLVTHNIEEAAYVGQSVLVLHRPPNRITHAVEIPHEAGTAYRLSQAYQIACGNLRARLGSRDL